MIDKNTITLTECANDGSYIYLYHQKDVNTWIAYGYSAFAVYLFDKENGLVSLHNYSHEMQLPCILTDNTALLELSKQAAEVLAQTDDVMTVRMKQAVDESAYQKWAEKLRTGQTLRQRPEYSKFSKDVPMGEFIPDGMSAFSRNLKRVFDCIAALFALIIFSPLIAFCWFLVRHEDGGPAIFKQERIGRFGRPFNIYKFRSMRMDAEKMGPQLSTHGGENDPRLTKIGAFIRAHHLDELPQLWNVFVGDMSFVGPRPERKFYIDQIIEHDKRYEYLYQIRPGVTSLATLYNGYTDTMEKMLRRLEYDLFYLKKRSFLLDLKILIKTFCSIVFGKVF